MSRAGYRKLLKATFTHDDARVEQISRELSDVTWNDSGLLVAAVFSLAMAGRFNDGGTEADVREFVNEARKEFTTADSGMKPLVIEGVIRAVMGEAEFLDGIPPVEGMQAQVVLTRKIFDEAEASEEQIDHVLDEAEKLLDQAV